MLTSHRVYSKEFALSGRFLQPIFPSHLWTDNTSKKNAIAESKLSLQPVSLSFVYDIERLTGMQLVALPGRHSHYSDSLEQPQESPAGFVLLVVGDCCLLEKIVGCLKCYHLTWKSCLSEACHPSLCFEDFERDLMAHHLCCLSLSSLQGTLSAIGQPSAHDVCCQ